MPKLYLTILAFALTLSACSRNIYISTDATQIVNSHQTIAIIPPVITNISTHRKKKDTSEEKEKEGLKIQQILINQLKNLHLDNQLSVDFLGMEETNSKLRNMGYPNKEISVKRLCQILGVDALITSSFSVRTIYQYAEVNCTMQDWHHDLIHVRLNLHDEAKGEIIWKFENKIEKSLGSRPSAATKDIVKSFVKFSPYGNVWRR